MSEISDRYRRVAAGFTERVEQVRDGDWDRPSPCDGWSARDIVRHLRDTAQMFLGRVGVDVPTEPSVDTDPAGSWTATRDAVQAALDDPEIASREYESPMGKSTLERGISLFGIGDVLVHTWDLARATELDETLDPEEVHRLFEAMEPMDEQLRQGTAFGPRVEVPADADEQTRLIAFTGRRPS